MLEEVAQKRIEELEKLNKPLQNKITKLESEIVRLKAIIEGDKEIVKRAQGIIDSVRSWAEDEFYTEFSDKHYDSYY